MILERLADRGAAAERKLAAVPVQRAGKTYMSYIENVLALCDCANSEMAETERVRCLLKSISEEAFPAHLVQNSMTVKDVT